VDEEGNDMERGCETFLCESQDGFRFEEVGHLHKSFFQASSVEKCACLPLRDGQLAWFVSYASMREDESRGMWCIDRILASDPQYLFRDDVIPERVLRPEFCPALEDGWVVTGVKDPFFLMDENGNYFFAGKYHMIISFSKARGESCTDLHGDGDCYNSGRILSCAAYLTSEDGVHFEWQDEILKPLQGSWFGYACRLTTALKEDSMRESWWGVVDGAASVSQNYHERATLISGASPKAWNMPSEEGPCLCPGFDSRSSFGGESGVRYVSALRHLGRLLLYYEFTCHNGSHDLRVAEAEINPC